MSISQDEIQKIAEKLSRLKGDDQKITDKITSTLSYLELLDEVDTQGITPTYNVIHDNLTLREDIVKESSVTPHDLLSCSNQKIVSGQILLPSIMK